jgi:hypothetical protein
MYLVFPYGRPLGLREFVKERPLWSGRLSTGSLGMPDCPAGNRGPRGSAEVVFGIGDEGLWKLADLGFIPCPVCKPEYKPGFWDAAQEAVERKYDLTSNVDFADKAFLPYDARRLAWEELVPLVGVPNRIYLPSSLDEVAVREFSARIGSLGVKIPPLGCYDKDAPGRFREYV